MTALNCEDVARAALGEPLKREGDELLYRCLRPERHANSDAHPSLKVNPHKNVWSCFPCNETGTAWGLAAFIARLSVDDKSGVTAWLKEHGLLKESKRKSAERGPRIEAEYPYLDERGNLLYVVERRDPKDFKVRRPNGDGGWIWSLDGMRRVLYRLPEVLATSDVLICEGEKDCNTARGIGFTATCNPHGAGKWCEEYSDSLRGKRVTIIADADEPGRKHAAQVAQSLLGKVTSLKLLEFSRAKDLSEWVEHGGTEQELLDLIRKTEEWKPPTIDRSALLNGLCAFIRRFVFLSESQARVASLWVVHTHAFSAADATPYLAITSAEKQSGKTRLLEVFETLVAKPWFTGKVTAAVLTRKIDAEQPTLLLDESDAAFSGDKEYGEVLRGVLNTGHRRGGKSSCCVGQGGGISFHDFSTFCPKAIAGIGRLPDTVADRAIPIRLKRAAPEDRIERFRWRDIEPDATSLREQIGVCASIGEKLRNARPEMPEELTDRQQDGAEPLLAIADAAGGEWPRLARRALLELCNEAQASDGSIGRILLGDIRQVFESRGVDRLSSAELACALAEIETSPWGEWAHGKALTKARLARLLKSYGILPDCIRIGEKTLRGYLAEQFQDAFRRYLRAGMPCASANPSSQSATLQHPASEAVPGDSSKCNNTEDVAASRCERINEDRTRCDVAVCERNPAWPPASLDAEQRFAQPHAKLFPFLGRKVRTPAEPGTLVQVFAHRVTVLLDSQLSRCSFFSPGEIEPVSREETD